MFFTDDLVFSRKVHKFKLFRNKKKTVPLPHPIKKKMTQNCKRTCWRTYQGEKNKILRKNGKKNLLEYLPGGKLRKLIVKMQNKIYFRTYQV